LNVDSYTTLIKPKAIEFLKSSINELGIRASAHEVDNYNRVWARDSTVAGLAILAQQQEDLYPSFRASLYSLYLAAHSTGQIPSNIYKDNTTEQVNISYGSTVGRTDTSLWWIIGLISYIKLVPDEALESIAKVHIPKIFNTIEAWEFNYKDLLYCPISSNWADEYITNGYVLNDNILYYWAMDLAGHFYENNKWIDKANAIKTSIKQHFCFEAELENSNFQNHQKEMIKDWNLKTNFISSFRPGEIINRYDAWSISLLMLLQIPSEHSIELLIEELEHIFNKSNQKGIPAFWPVINEEDRDFETLKYNCNYTFKNNPGHYHNGGMWGIVNGFVATALYKRNKTELADRIFSAMCHNLTESMDLYPFPEYYDLQNAQPKGVMRHTFSTAGYLIAERANVNDRVLNLIFNDEVEAQSEYLETKATKVCELLVDKIDFTKDVFVISIAGESGSGKTTLANTLKRILLAKNISTDVINQDEYFKLPPKKNHQKRVEVFSHIGPNEVRLDLMDNHIDLIACRNEKQLFLPKMNWTVDKEEQEPRDFAGIKVLIVEGTYTSLLKNTNLKVFINASYIQTKQNRINRNRETITPFIERVLQKESEIIQSHAPLVDVVIDVDFKIVKPK
jgi:uridine kinase